jgi:hypothetical protein
MSRMLSTPRWLSSQFVVLILDEIAWRIGTTSGARILHSTPRLGYACRRLRRGIFTVGACILLTSILMNKKIMTTRAFWMRGTKEKSKGPVNSFPQLKELRLSWGQVG